MILAVATAKVACKSGKVLLAQPAHVANVLGLIVVVDAAVHRVDDGAGAEEEAGLEEGVGEDVEEPRRERAMTTPTCRGT